jgi:hypothetical protein
VLKKYIDWVLNSKDARAKWIREQLKSGNLKGKQILYYTELNEPSHATALDYLINKYDWNTESTSTSNQEVDTPTPKIGETTTEVKERFTITKTVASDNTALSVHTNNDTGEVTKSEYATTYPDIYSDELGDKYTLVIYRDSANPSVITDVESFDPKDKKNSIGSYGKQGNQTDEKFITTFTEESDVTLEYTNKFEKSLPVVKPKTPTTATPKQTTPPVSPVELESTKVKPSIGEITHNPEMDSEINKGIKNYSPINIRFIKEYGTVYAKPVSIPGYENIKFSIYKDSKGQYKIVETSTGMLMPSFTGLRKIQDVINSVKSELDKHSLSKIESVLDKELTLNKGFDYVFTKQSESIKQEPITGKPVVAETPTPSQDTTPPVEAATAEGTTDVSEAPNTKETQTSDDAEALIEALRIEAEKRITLEDADTLKLDALNNLISLAYGHEITDEELGDIAQVFGEDLLNEALRIKGLPLSKREQAQRYLEQVRTAIEGILNVELYIDSVTAKILKKYKDTLLGLMTERGQNTDNAKKIFEILEDYVGTAKEGVTTKSESEGETADSVQESKPTHNVPKNILNKLLTAKHIVGDLLSVSNGVFNTKEAKYAVDLLTALIGLKGSVLVVLSDNIGIIKEDGTFENETISEEVQSKMLNKNIGYARGNKIYVKLNHKATVDTLQVLVHEYHHAVTAEFLDSIAGNAEHPINKALHGIRKAVEAHLDSGAEMKSETATRLEYAITNFKELITVGTTETSVIAQLRAVEYGEGSIFDALVKQTMAILKLANPTTFNQLEGTLNDIFDSAKGSVKSNETSSTNSPNDSTGEAANTGSQESGDNSTESIIEDTTSTGQASGEATTVTNQTEVGDGKVTVLQGVTESVREEERSRPFPV